MLSLNTNVSSLNTRGVIARTEVAHARTTERLSSGKRINAGKDDAAGLATAKRMGAQTRSLNQVVRNLNDGFSVAQTAEAAMQEVSSMLERARELAVQAANDAVLTAADKNALQAEVSEILTEIDRISDTTEFNGMTLLNHGDGTNMTGGDDTQVELLTKLKSGYLEGAEDRITQAYGLTGDGVDLDIKFLRSNDGVGGQIAFVTTSFGATGLGTVTGLSFDMEDYDPDLLGDFDRIVAHEMTHAVMARTTNWGHMNNNGVNGNQTWFLEGADEFIHGADERIQGRLTAGDTSLQIAQSVNAAWTGSDRQYAGADVALAYLHQDIIQNQNNTLGIRALMDSLAADPVNTTLDQAFAAVSSYADEAAFMADFAGANGATFIDGLDLGNADTGSVRGSDHDYAGNGYAALDQESVIGDGQGLTDDPLEGFNELYPDLGAGEIQKTLSISSGFRADQTIEMDLAAADTTSMGIASVDVARDANEAMTQLDLAISYLADQRSNMGAAMNRIDHTLSSTQSASDSTEGGRSRIEDADFAHETGQHTRTEIIRQASIAMLAQAHSLPQVVLQLLG